MQFLVIMKRLVVFKGMGWRLKVNLEAAYMLCARLSPMDQIRLPAYVPHPLTQHESYTKLANSGVFFVIKESTRQIHRPGLGHTIQPANQLLEPISQNAKHVSFR